MRLPGEAEQRTDGELWKLPRLMEMLKIEIRKRSFFLMIFHIPTAAWKTLHLTPFDSEFPTVPTAPGARYISVKSNRETSEWHHCSISCVAPLALLKLSVKSDRGWESRKLATTPAREKFFLDTPFHRTL